MPLGSRDDYKDSEFCGLAIGKPSGLSRELDEVARPAGFDFLATNLSSAAHHETSPNTTYDASANIRDDLVDLQSSTSGKFIGVVSAWVQLDAPEEKLRTDSHVAFIAELEWAQFAGLQAAILPTPHSFETCVHYAQAVNTVLTSVTCTRLWIKLPLYETSAQNAGVWLWWNTLRSMCKYHAMLAVCLELKGVDVGQEFSCRWEGDAARALLLPTSSFTLNKRGYPVLPKPLQALVQRLLAFHIQVIIQCQDGIDSLSAPFASPVVSEASQASDRSSRGALCPTPAEAAAQQGRSGGTSQTSTQPATSSARFRPEGAAVAAQAYQEYLSYLFGRLPVLSALEQAEMQFRDQLQMPLQPLADNLESATYETFERDAVKYESYRLALLKAIQDKANELGSEPDGARTVQVAVLGAGRGPLVDATVSAADELRVRVCVWAIEKNANAVLLLRRRVQAAAWKGRVTVVATDMRSWKAPHAIDILVSELLGSFGDNELSPECLDEGLKVMHERGICIPESYTSYLAPISSHFLHSSIVQMAKQERFHSPMVCKLWRHVRLAEAQAAFSFSHPSSDAPIDNSRSCSLRFSMHPASLPAAVHGFAGYFEATLYKDVTLSTVPRSHTTNMHSWFPMYFPLEEPVLVLRGQHVGAAFFRIVRGTKVWYEWAVSHPIPSRIHNARGEHYAISSAVDTAVRKIT